MITLTSGWTYTFTANPASVAAARPIVELPAS